MNAFLNIANEHAELLAGLHEQLDQTTVVFERQLASDLSSVNRLCLHIERYRGKMLRPSLVILCGLAAKGERDFAALTDRHRVVGAVVEMIHMATLVHDDILDDADVRRRGETVNRKWGNEAAVMLGDYLISNAFHLCSTLGDPTINEQLGAVTNKLCEGELLQLNHRNDFSIDETTYREIVTRKTASLIGACCRLGAQLSDADKEVAEALSRYGTSLGIAFQIQDDLLDLLGEQRVVGKSLGRDLEKGKLTLPMIVLLRDASPAERSRILDLAENRQSEPLELMLQQSGAVEQSRSIAAKLVADAHEELHALPSGPARELLRAMADQVVQRSY